MGDGEYVMRVLVQLVSLQIQGKWANKMGYAIIPRGALLLLSKTHKSSRVFRLKPYVLNNKYRAKKIKCFQGSMATCFSVVLLRKSSNLKASSEQ